MEIDGKRKHQEEVKIDAEGRKNEITKLRHQKEKRYPMELGVMEATKITIKRLELWDIGNNMEMIRKCKCGMRRRKKLNISLGVNK